MTAPGASTPASLERFAFAFVDDLLDAGLEPILLSLAADGFTAVAPAVVYHHGRDILPRNPRRVVRFHDGGASHVQVPGPRGSGIRLPSTRLAAGQPLARIVEGARRQGLGVFAWIVLTHNSRVGARFPSAAVANAFGDRIVHALCPTNPHVHDLAERVVRAVADEGVDGLVVESVGFGELDHGYHHERSVAPTSAGLRFLLGLCVCRWCTSSAEGAGVDVETLRRRIVEATRRELDGGAAVGMVRQEVIEEIAGGGLVRYLRVRERSVEALVSRIVASARAAGIHRVTILDPAGGMLGYATGRPDPGLRASELGWRTGLDVAATSDAGAIVGVLGYVADQTRLVRELDGYRSKIGPNGQMDVVLRPMPPDVRTTRDLAGHVDAATRAGAVGLGMYHLGLASREAWSRVRSVLAH